MDITIHASFLPHNDPRLQLLVALLHSGPGG
jgi:hypothetical protein